MEIRELEAFLAVVEEGHFRYAAHRLRISQSQVSRLIGRLEESLGVRLLDRSTRKVTLTNSGQSLLAEAEATLAAANQVRVAARAAARGEHGMLAIGTPSSMPFTAIFPKIIRSFGKRYPAVQFTVHEAGANQQVAGLLEKTLDVGFVRLPIKRRPRSVTTQPILSEPLLLALPESHPLANAEVIEVARLASEPFITYSHDIGGGLHDLTLEVCRRAGFRPNTQQEALRVPMAVSLVAAGLGVAFVPDAIREVHLPGVVYRPLDDALALAEVALVFRSDERSPVVRNFIAISRSWRE